MTDPKTHRSNVRLEIAYRAIGTHHGLSNHGWRWWLLLLLIGVLSLGVRFYYLTHAQVLQPVNDQAHTAGDGVEYYAYARNLSRHGVFSKALEGTLPLVGDSYRDPGYPAFLAGLMKLFPRWETWYPVVLLSQGLLSALGVVLALCLSRRWMSMPWLAAGGLLMAIWPHSVSMPGYILSETLFGFLCMLSLFLLDQSLDRRSVAWAAASGIGFALGALTNAVLLPFAPMLALYFAYRRKISRGMFIGLLSGALILPAAWAVRDAQLAPLKGNSSTGRALDNLVVGSWPDFYQTYAGAMKKNPGALRAMDRVSRGIALSHSNLPAELDDIAQRVCEQPLDYLRWYLSKPALLWSWDIRIGQGDIYVYPTRHSPFKDNAAFRTVIAFCHAFNPLLFVLMIAGGCFALWPRRQVPLSLVACTLLLVFVTTVFSVLQAEPRYAIPYRPLEILLAVFAVHQVGRWMASMRSR
jgi:hypothetical protein